jgi:hypothetical protein
MAAPQALGRGGHLGAHLAGGARDTRLPGPARLDHGPPRRLVRGCQAGWREGRVDPEGQGRQVDVGGRRQWPTARIPSCWRRLRRGPVGTTDVGHHPGHAAAGTTVVICAISCGAMASVWVSPSGGAPPHGEPGAARPIVAGKEDERQRYRVERSFAELWQFPAPRDPLGTRLQRLPERIRVRRPAAVCAPSDCPRVPDPVGVRRARAVDAAVDAARSVQPSWSTNRSWPNQRIRV